MLRLLRNLSIPPKDLENLVIRVLQETGVELDRSTSVASHRPEKTIIKFLNRKDTETVFLNKKN